MTRLGQWWMKEAIPGSPSNPNRCNVQSRRPRKSLTISGKDWEGEARSSSDEKLHRVAWSSARTTLGRRGRMADNLRSATLDSLEERGIGFVDGGRRRTNLT